MRHGADEDICPCIGGHDQTVCHTILARDVVMQCQMNVGSKTTILFIAHEAMAI